MKPWIRKIGKDGKPPSWRPADDVRAPYRSGHVEAKTRAKRAVKCSISLRKTGSSTALILFVGLRRPLAFGLPVPLRVQFDDWIREHSTARRRAGPHSFISKVV